MKAHYTAIYRGGRGCHWVEPEAGWSSALGSNTKASTEKWPLFWFVTLDSIIGGLLGLVMWLLFIGFEACFNGVSQWIFWMFKSLSGLCGTLVDNAGNHYHIIYSFYRGSINGIAVIKILFSMHMPWATWFILFWAQRNMCCGCTSSRMKVNHMHWLSQVILQLVCLLSACHLPWSIHMSLLSD